jgi:hypothetical protein
MMKVFRKIWSGLKIAAGVLIVLAMPLAAWGADLPD